MTHLVLSCSPGCPTGAIAFKETRASVIRRTHLRFNLSDVDFLG